MRGARRLSVRPFPGEKSPGLIEASCGSVPGCTIASTFPGEKSPGLIEAEDYQLGTLGYQVSGGEIPRPH